MLTTDIDDASKNYSRSPSKSWSLQLSCLSNSLVSPTLLSL
jgi:hypothetical protein